MWTEGKAARLTRELNAHASTGDGQWHFSVWEHGSPVVSLNGAVPVTAASTIKVPLLVVALQDVAAGRRSLNDEVAIPVERVGGAGVLRLLPSVTRLSLAEALTLMIVVSDNVATNAVIDLFGVADTDQRITTLGLRGTRLRRRLMDQDAAMAGLENVTTADDQAALLDRLAGAELLPDRLREFALDALGEQQVNDRMPVRLAEDVRCLHKTGELHGVRHDVGLLVFDDRMVSLAALGTGLTSPGDRRLSGAGNASAVIGAAAETVVAIARR
ncbi:beta-lactamase class A [Tamaricihabitans halophyticus]|uniref:Beta-lactamase class A n=1 Tax=Tamaricihabitans halophyticus TaxID=1262583 RepID=A0A4R2QWX1_9PSEU|nr:serine hydrolase [Tamaricihabitans halophyticus]TCP53458.1 beta-lactamase class A [Tamaricihabitans halophyticus]